MDEMICDPQIIYEARELRDAAGLKFAPDIKSRQVHIGRLVGNPNPYGSFVYTKDWTTDLITGISPKTLHLLRALNGPNGYTVYKMLLAQQEVKDGSIR